MRKEMAVIGKGAAGQVLTEEEIRGVVRSAAGEMGVAGKRVLTIIPDGTRTMPMAMLFGILQQEIGKRAAKSDYLVALGTHPRMSDEQLTRMLGRAVADGVCEGAEVWNHRWDLPETLVAIGTIAASEVEEVSGGLLREAIEVKINRLIFEYDQVLICGPVFPHEVIGFSGGNKYLFPGISGKEMIDHTHWLGALIGSSQVMGEERTPMRELVDRAAAKIKVPVACLAMVVRKEGVAGIYFGEARETWSCAAKLSAQTHIEWVERPFERVLAVMPEMYPDMWTAAKGMYKAEPAIADGGEVVVYAPHITEFSYTHGEWIERIGYHCRDYFLKQWEKFAEVPRGVVAHATHLRGPGTYDAERGVEKDRIRVTLATGIAEERCQRANLGYMDPATVRLEEWVGRESEGIKVVARAGEILYRLQRRSAS